MIGSETDFVQLVEKLTVFILRGLTMLVIGGAVYEAGQKGFRIFDEFQTKEIAQISLVAFVIFIPVIENIVKTTWTSITAPLNIVQNIGVILIMSRLIANSLFDDWNFDDDKSLAFYIVGGLLSISPWIINSL